MNDAIKKAGCVSESARKDANRSKAEKALRMINEILEEEGEVSDWFYGELKKIFSEEEMAKAS